MPEEAVLITGANGEVGHGLISHFVREGRLRIVATDLQPLDETLKPLGVPFVQGDILDRAMLERLFAEHAFAAVYHLASILSTKAERNPELAHQVNADGTLNLLAIAARQAREQARSIVFLYPSSIAAYGLPSPQAKQRAGRVKEDQWNFPATMYGCNKLYGEHLGRYYALHYRRLDLERAAGGIDFRALRFPGLISGETVPTGGTSDYGPEMLHHAAQGQAYACFVREDACLPFMVMPDAVRALVLLSQVPRRQLQRLVYNVSSFSLSAGAIARLTLAEFPGAQVVFQPDLDRQGIVDSWPRDVDDSAARRDWNWVPAYDKKRAFSEYLIPAIRRRYPSR